MRTHRDLNVSFQSVLISTRCLDHARPSYSPTDSFLQLYCMPWSTMRRHVSGSLGIMFACHDRSRVQSCLAQCKKRSSRRSTRETKKAETALAELRGRAEAEKEGLKAAAAGAEERHAAVQTSVAKLEQELQSYKVCAPCLGRRLFKVCGADA